MTSTMQAPASVKILAVDDIAANLTALDAVLAKPGVEIVHASSGAQALELLLEHDFGLAILDVHMPGMDGFELAELMRGSKRTRHIPILFLTAAGEDSQRAFRGYATGAVDFLFKPIDARVLAAKVDVFVQLAQQKQQLAEQLEIAQQLLKTNEMLMAVLAHDLRTPLSAIIASASFLERFGGEERLRPATDRISRSGQRMARMVDQLLHVARLHGGRVSLMPQHSDLRAVCAAIVDECEVLHGKSRVTLQTVGDMHATIDPVLVGQVVQKPGRQRAASWRPGRADRCQRGRHCARPRGGVGDQWRRDRCGTAAAYLRCVPLRRPQCSGRQRRVRRARAGTLHHPRTGHAARWHRRGDIVAGARHHHLHRHAAARMLRRAARHPGVGAGVGHAGVVGAAGHAISAWPGWPMHGRMRRGMRRGVGQSGVRPRGGTPAKRRRRGAVCLRAQVYCAFSGGDPILTRQSTMPTCRRRRCKRGLRAALRRRH